jgi:hypothetical protein
MVGKVSRSLAASRFSAETSAETSVAVGRVGTWLSTTVEVVVAQVLSALLLTSTERLGP